MSDKIRNNKIISIISNKISTSVNLCSIGDKIKSNVLYCSISNKISNKNKYITMGDYNRRMAIRTHLKLNNIILTYRKDWVKIGLGGVCVAVAVFPNGLGFVFYTVGFSLLISGGVDLFGMFKTSRTRFKSWVWRKTGFVF